MGEVVRYENLMSEQLKKTENMFLGMSKPWQDFQTGITVHAQGNSPAYLFLLVLTEACDKSLHSKIKLMTFDNCIISPLIKHSLGKRNKKHEPRRVHYIVNKLNISLWLNKMQLLLSYKLRSLQFTSVKYACRQCRGKFKNKPSCCHLEQCSCSQSIRCQWVHQK